MRNDELRYVSELFLSSERAFPLHVNIGNIGFRILLDVQPRKSNDLYFVNVGKRNGKRVSSSVRSGLKLEAFVH